MGRIKTTEQFITDARKVHGDKYDYSKTKYNRHNEKVIIICPKHGEFLQTPNGHMFFGCPKCGQELAAENRKKTTDEFKAEAEKIYGNKYTYNQVVYKNNHTKITVTCPVHGDFTCLPCHFLTGAAGCQYCKKEEREKKKEERNKILQKEKAKKKKEQYIQKLHKLYPEKYDYSRTDFTDCHKAITVICPEHGTFITDMYAHTSGRHRCPECVEEERRKKKLIKFIIKAKVVHGDKYDYSKTSYINSRTKVLITCPEHGDFWQLPAAHLRGQNCRRCSDKMRGPHKK